MVMRFRNKLLKLRHFGTAICLLRYVRRMALSEHLKPLRLFDLSQGKVKPSAEERQHVYECEECRTVITIFARQFTPRNPPKDESGNAA